MGEESATITRSRAIELINASIDNFATFYDSYCHDNKGNLSQEEIELYEQMNEAVYIVRTDKNYRNDLENMPREDLTEFLLSCKEMAENHDLTIKFSYPKGKILIVENESTNPELIEKTLEKLEVYGDLRIKNAIKEYHSGERAIRFSNMPKNQYGKTVCINDKYSHFVTEQFNRDIPENQVLLAVTLAHEFKRNASSDSIEAETRELILEDTKIIESFADSYGEGIYKKFPEYGILHYIKKLFGETELKDFAEYAFDSSGSYWKVNDKGELIDDGNVSQVKDVGGNVIYSGSKGRQGTLQEWLGLANAFTALMQPAGYEWSGTEKKWTKNPGKITHSVIEQAHKDGKLTDDQYNLIQLAAGLTARNKKEEKASLFVQVLRDYQKAEQIRTQIQIDMVNRAWEWIKKKWTSVINNKSNKGNRIISTNELDFESLMKQVKIDDLSGSCCDLYSTRVLELVNKKPGDWPNSSSYKICNTPSFKGNNYKDFYSSKWKKLPSDGWNVMIMWAESGETYADSPHMAILQKNTDLYNLTHFTGNKQYIRTNWSYSQIINGFNYSNFRFMALGK